LCLAFHKSPKHEFCELHDRLNTNCFAWPPTFGTKSWRLSKTICIQPFMELLCFMLRGTMRGRAKNFFAWPLTFGVKVRGWAKKIGLAFHGVFELHSQGLHERSLLELLSSKGGWGKFVCAWPPTFNVEIWRPSAKCFSSASL